MAYVGMTDWLTGVPGTIRTCDLGRRRAALFR